MIKKSKPSQLIYYTFIILITTFSPVFSQVSEEIPQLKVGDHLPNVLLEILSPELSKSNLKDFEGKPLILDFWATWCRPCVQDLVKLDSIQKANPKLKILLVTLEKKEVIENFIQQVKPNISFDVPTVVNDTYLFKAFKITQLPQLVWISENGYVLAISYSDHLTEANIKDLIKGNTLTRIPKRKGGMGRKLPDAGKPLFAQRASKVEDSVILGYSILTKYLDTFHSAIGGKGTEFGGQGWGDSKTKLLFTNQTPSYLYQIAYAELLGDAFFTLNDRIFFNTKDSLKYTYPANVTNLKAQEWNYSNTYSYDISVPVRDTGKIYEYMRYDLAKYFPLKANIIEKKRICLELSATSTDLFATKGGEVKRDFNPYYLRYRNVPIKQLFTDLKILWDSKIPLVDKINYKGNIDLELKCDLNDKQKLVKALAAYNIVSNVSINVFKQLELTDN